MSTLESMLLKSGVDLRAPVTDFLPQLQSNRSKIRCEDVTLEMLADHLAGIPPNGIITLSVSARDPC
jgi:actin-related protein 6